MTGNRRLSEELSARPARLRIDIHGSTPLEDVLDDRTVLD